MKPKIYPVTLIMSLFLMSYMYAQPSGGPYGPLKFNYELPEVSGKVYFVATDGKETQSGLEISKPTTIEAAIKKAESGDAIVMRGGTYRSGNLQFNQSILIQPYKDENPVLKGSFIANDWQQQDNGLWVTTWQRLFPKKPDSWWRRHRHGSIIPQHRFNNDMVFVDGRFLQSAGWEGELDADSYYIDYETGKVYLKVDPRYHTVEITAFDVALLIRNDAVNGKQPDRKGPQVRGITFTQYAYRAIEIMGSFPAKLSPESEHGKDITGTTFEHCTISFCSRVAGYFRGDKLTIRHCRISDTSTEGLYILSSSDVLLEKNIITRNNIENLNGYYPSAVKIFNQCYRVTCRDNLVIDHTNSVGIWYDVGNVDGIFVNNWIENVHYDEKYKREDDFWPNGAGFFFEISSGAVCAGNVFINCDSGVHLRNAADVQIYQNTFVNSQVLIGRTERTAQGDHFDWHPSTGPGIDERFGHIFKNNLMVGLPGYDKPLLSVWQRAVLCGRINSQQLDKLDNNVYVHTSEPSPLLLWSPLQGDDCSGYLKSPQDLHKLYSEFAGHSRYYKNYRGPLFRSADLGHIQLLPEFDVSKVADPLPEKIRTLLGDISGRAAYIGAYPDSD